MMRTLTEQIERAERNADPSENAALDAAIRKAARLNPEFTTDQVWDVCDTRVREPRALGARMIAAVRDGLIIKKACGHCGSDQFENSDRSQAQHNPKRIYVSLTYAPLELVAADPSTEPGYWD